MILTPLASGSFTSSFPVTLSQIPTGPATSGTIVIQNLQCGTLTNQVVFSLTFNGTINYPTAGGPVAEAFSVPYANALASAGTVAGMYCDVAATITAATFVTATRVLTVTFTITANTDFPPPQAIDVDSNIGVI